MHFEKNGLYEKIRIEYWEAIFRLNIVSSCRQNLKTLGLKMVILLMEAMFLRRFVVLGGILLVVAMTFGTIFNFGIDKIGQVQIGNDESNSILSLNGDSIGLLKGSLHFGPIVIGGGVFCLKMTESANLDYSNINLTNNDRTELFGNFDNYEVHAGLNIPLGRRFYVSGEVSTFKMNFEYDDNGETKTYNEEFADNFVARIGVGARKGITYTEVGIVYPLKLASGYNIWDHSFDFSSNPIELSLYGGFGIAF
jgi:hypothetical protein